MLSEIAFRRSRGRWECLLILLLVGLAFGLRVHQVDFYSLSEDESAKWAAIQEYRHGHFAGVNSEHPMLPKMLAWGSVAAGERWNRLAEMHGWQSMRPEGWLRLPNVIFGALTGALLYLLCRQLMGIPGSFAAALFWAVSPLPIALNRLTKEETPLTLFTLLACYFYCRAQQSHDDRWERRWYDLSAAGFGLALGSQYILHLLGLNGLAWYIAGKWGLNKRLSQFRYTRFYAVMFISFILVNPVVLSPGNFQAILGWLHHDGVKHSGYDFGGILYLNFPSRFFTGVPWFYYGWLLLVKTPLPILAAILAGSVMLVRNRRTLASCYFLSLGVIQLAGLSISGAKWIRYSLPLLPFLYLAGGYAVQQLWSLAQRSRAPLRLAVLPVVVVVSALLFEIQSWAPFYSFYLNPLGGGKQNVAHYFAPDEVSEFDTREVAQRVCSFAPAEATLATARPMSMSYYLQACQRPDVHVVPLYDPQYAPRDGDFVVLEPSRRFMETQRYFDVLASSGMPHDDVRVGPLSASTIYLYQSSVQETRRLDGDTTFALLHRSEPRPAPVRQAWRNARNSESADFSRRFVQ